MAIAIAYYLVVLMIEILIIFAIIALAITLVKKMIKYFISKYKNHAN